VEPNEQTIVQCVQFWQNLKEASIVSGQWALEHDNLGSNEIDDPQQGI
jgi:hypothetical protein